MSQQIKCKCKVISNLWKLKKIINWRTLSGKITKTRTVLPDERRWVLCFEFKGSSSSAKGLLMRQKAYPRGHWNNTEQQPRDYFIYFIRYFAYQHWKLPHCKLAMKKWRLINGENEGKQSNLINKIGKENSSCLNKLSWESKVLTLAPHIYLSIQCQGIKESFTDQLILCMTVSFSLMNFMYARALLSLEISKSYEC